VGLRGRPAGPRVITALLPPGAEVEPGRVGSLPDDERHHLRVRRADALGTTLRWTDGRGRHGTARLVSDRGEVEWLEVHDAPAPVPLLLAVAAGDRERWLWLAEKAAELGATVLLPVETERSRHVSTRLRPEQVARIEARAREALKQCGAVWAPIVTPIMPIAELPARVEGSLHRWLADGAGDAPAALHADSGVAVAIGPEGGFTEGERVLLTTEGFTPVRLGPHILRFETAALAAAAHVAVHRRT
jgi:16S rRNA (uracil1498-N3)-methyltransferase